MDPKRPSAVSARDDREGVGDINLITGELSGPRKCTPRTSDDRGGEEGLEEEGEEGEEEGATEAQEE